MPRLGDKDPDKKLTKEQVKRLAEWEQSIEAEKIERKWLEFLKEEGIDVD